VVDAMKIELLGEAPKAEVVNSEAYSLWLKGRFVYAKWGKENFESAIDAYRQAIAIEPTFAQAWASLSVAYLTQTNSGYLAREEGLILARDAIDRALVLQPELPEALARLAVIQAQFEWDWSGAISSVEKALQLDPENTIVLSAAGNVMSSVGRSKDALQHFESILTIEPLDLIGLYNTASQLNVLGRPEDAERTYRQLLELNPQDWGTHTQLALIMLQQGRLDEAWEELKLEVDPQQQEWGRLIALHVMGRAEEADQRLQAFTQEHASWAAPLIAQVYAWREEPDAAFEWLYRAREERDSNLPAMVWEPVFADMRLDPRWTELMAAMGLEE
jgi:tetratricopeptide (TPR) repeat protein